MEKAQIIVKIGLKIHACIAPEPGTLEHELQTGIRKQSYILCRGSLLLRPWRECGLEITRGLTNEGD